VDNLFLKRTVSSRFYLFTRKTDLTSELKTKTLFVVDWFKQEWALFKFCNMTWSMTSNDKRVYEETRGYLPDRHLDYKVNDNPKPPEV